MTSQTDNLGFVSFNDLEKDKDESGFVPFSPDTTPEFEEPPSETDDEEGWGKWLVRSIYQVPSGIAQAITYPLDLMSMLASGEARDPEEIEHIRMISEREGIPFDEKKYMQAVEQAERTFPTQSNIERGVEEYTGFPTQAKTKFQKGLKFASTGGTLSGSKGLTAGKEALQYSPMGIRGANVALPRPVLGAGLEATKEILNESGLPEPISELASFGILKHPSEGASSLQIGKKRKESGLVERQFEKTKSPTNVSEDKLSQINSKLESDFKEISSKIIDDSPIGETARNLANDPTYIKQSEQLLEQSQSIADSLQGTLDSKIIKKEFANEMGRSIEGFKANEYDIEFAKFMKNSINNFIEKEVKPGQLVKQYRKNNKDLRDYYEPGASKALNRAKKDALLAENRAITKVMEENYPDSELVPVFKEGNDRWSKIKSVETIDELVENIFPENKKVNFKEIKDAINDNNYQRIFKKELGEKGFKDFNQLLEDMLTSEKPYKMLKVAEKSGLDVGNLIKTGSAYFLSPHIGHAKIAYDTARKGYRSLMNAMLDKPRISITFKEAVQDLKKGNFSQAEKKFEKLQEEIEMTEKKKPPYEKIKRPNQ